MGSVIKLSPKGAKKLKKIIKEGPTPLQKKRLEESKGVYAEARKKWEWEEEQKRKNEISERVDELLRVPQEWRMEMWKKLEAEMQAKASADEFVKLVIELSRKFYHAKTRNKRVKIIVVEKDSIAGVNTFTGHDFYPTWEKDLEKLLYVEEVGNLKMMKSTNFLLVLGFIRSILTMQKDFLKDKING